jgi:hypothetical protein
MLAYGLEHAGQQPPGFRRADPPDLGELLVGRADDFARWHRRHVDDRDAGPRVDPAPDDAYSADPEPSLLERLPDGRVLPRLTRLDLAARERPRRVLPSLRLPMSTPMRLVTIATATTGSMVMSYPPRRAQRPSR